MLVQAQFLAGPNPLDILGDLPHTEPLPIRISGIDVGPTQEQFDTIKNAQGSIGESLTETAAISITWKAP